MLWRAAAISDTRREAQSSCTVLLGFVLMATASLISLTLDCRQLYHYQWGAWKNRQSLLMSPLPIQRRVDVSEDRKRGIWKSAKLEDAILCAVNMAHQKTDQQASSKLV